MVNFGDFLSLFERGNLANGSFRFLWILDFRHSLRSLDMKFWFCQFFLKMEGISTAFTMRAMVRPYLLCPPTNPRNQVICPY
ncbi:unnamed protein product [Rhizophagus irregularis]|nr:unnamed protein product [Rhizophagus irregularis]